MQCKAMVVAEAEGHHVLSCPCWTKSLEERKKGQKKVTPDIAEQSRIGNVFTQLISCLLYTQHTVKPSRIIITVC